MSEGQIQRIATNYLRMMLSFGIGIALLNILLGFGADFFAAVMIAGSSVGLAQLIKEVIRGATIPSLGRSFHSGSTASFGTAYAQALIWSVVAAVFSAVVLGSFAAFIGQFKLAPEIVPAAAYFILTRIVSTCFGVLLSPTLNLFPISGRMGWYNFWLTLERFAEFAAAVAVFLLLKSAPAADQLEWFGTLSMVLMSFTSVAGALHAYKVSGAGRPDFSGLNLASMKQDLWSVGWNGAAVASVSLYLRFDVFAVNVLYGPVATVIFGLSSQLAAYTRQLTMGLVTGLDAVVTRLATGDGKDNLARVAQLSALTLSVQALILFSASVFLVFHAETLVQLVFGPRLSAGITTGDVSLSFLLMMGGMIARGLSEGWMGVLAGIGRIGSYAPIVLCGALLNPFLVIAAGFILDPYYGLLSVSALFFLLNFIFHLVAVPWVTAQELSQPVGVLMSPLLRPAVLSLLCAVLIFGVTLTSDNGMVNMLVSAAVVAAVTGVPFFRGMQQLSRWRAASREMT